MTLNLLSEINLAAVEGRERWINLAVCLLYLLPGAVWDARTRMIPGWYLLSGLAAGTVGRILLTIMGRIPLADLCLCMMPGTMLLVLSHVTGEKIGYGDGVFFLVTGLLVGWLPCVIILMFSILFSSAGAAFLFLHRPGNRSRRIPFLPFVAGGVAAAFLIMGLW